ncbi:MAG: acetylornithine aminotransferase apoenzyme [Chthonomonadales bacterium]|nr:acetylornithine aminotransferase apoenzyme [Chthonomonadales bacterium]
MGTHVLEEGALLSALPTDTEAIMALDRDYVMGTYARQPVVFVRGEGARLWDSEGREYLDFLSGIAVAGVGHCHPKVAGAIAEQAHRLMHISNLFHNPLAAKLAERLCNLADMDKVFFCNSGTEANEAALKIARKWGKQKRGAECIEIITFTGSFHGRTMGAVSATAQPKYQAPFAPLVPGFIYAPLNDLATLDELITEKTCAVMIEPLQGESGVNPATPEFLAGVRALCDEAEVLLILDEIQCGMGRTGHFLASQGVGVQGDIVTMAKGIADGFPMGACLARGSAATTLVPGDHGSTFAGQPLACAASLATLDVMEEEGLMARASEVGAYFKARLLELQKAMPTQIKEVRGRGLMVGLQLTNPDAKTVHKYLMEAGIVVNATSDTTLRFVPPLIVSNEDCDRVVTTIEQALRAL